MKALTNPIFTTLKGWFAPPDFPDDEDKTRIAAILNIILWILLALVLLTEPVIFFTPTTGDRKWFLYLSGFLAPALLGTVLYLLRKGYVKFAAWTFVFFQWFSTIAQVIASGGMNSPALSAFIVSVLLAGFLISDRIALLFAGLSLTAIVLIMQADARGFIPPAVLFDTSSGKFRILASTLLVTAAMLSLIIQSLKNAMRKSRTYAQQLEQERAALEEAVQARTAELDERRHVEARLLSVFENSPDIIFEIDRAGTILFANRHADLFEGKTVYQLVAPDKGYEQQIAAGIEKAFETGERMSLEFLTQENDGSLAWNSIRVGPVQAGNQVTGLVAIVTNIHAQKEAAAQIQRRAEQLATIVEIGRAVSTLQDLDTVLESIYQQMKRIAPVDAFLISLLDKEKNQLSFPLTLDEGIRYNEPNVLLRSTSRLAKTIASGQPFRIHRTLAEIAEAEKLTSGMGNSNRKSGSLLYIPLWQANEVIGVLSVQSYSLNAYPDELVETLVGIGDQVAIAIQNARLFMNVRQELTERQQAEQQIQQRLKELAAIHTVSQAAVSELEFDNLFDLVSNELFKLFDIQEIYFALHDQQTDLINFPYYRHGDQRIQTTPVPFGQGLSSHVILTRQPLLINNDYERRSAELGVVRFASAPGNLRQMSWLGVPIQPGEQVIGMICVINLERENAFTDSDVRLLTTMAANLGIAIRNAQLYTTAQQELAERQRAEAQVRELNTELEHRVVERTAQLEFANRELEAFSFSVSHDLRAPLRHINSFAKIIKNDFAEGLEPTGRDFLEKVLTAGDRMNHLIDDLLDFSRLTRRPLHKQETDMRALVAAVIESFAPETAGRQIEWIITELPPVEADPTLLRPVYTNLIGNAIKYTGKRDLTRIEVGCVHRDNEQVYFVRDNGAGFDMKYADKLFGVFQRLHREDEFEGTGIGLATVQRIIARHGGRIWAEAEPDKGATFYFTIGTAS